MFGFGRLTMVVKNLMILNGLVFLLMMMERNHPVISDSLMLHYIFSPGFRPHQLVTHLFMHADIGHLAGNMISLWVFGSMLESVWGPKRFLIFYMVTGLSASLADQVYMYFQYHDKIELWQRLYEASNNRNVSNYTLEVLQSLRDGFRLLGASGAVYALVMAAGLLFSNTALYIFGIFEMKIKYIALLMLSAEIYREFVSNERDGVGHFVHLMGMAFGFLLVQIWKRDRKKFY